ncbi:28661_t:CDS:2, partial [Racocetra persica]
VRKEKKHRDQEVSSGRQDTSEELMSSHSPSTNNDVSQLPAEDSNPEKNMIYVGDLTIGTTPYLAYLFNKAEKTSRKKKLQWYYYSEEYEKKVKTISLENNISDQIARTQIYDEMVPYLPGIKR